MSDHHTTDEENQKENAPEFGYRPTLSDRIRFVSLAKYKRLEAQFDHVHGLVLNEKRKLEEGLDAAMAKVRELAQERDQLRLSLEQARLTPSAKADTEAAYQRGYAAALQNLGRYLLVHTLPPVTAKAKELVAAARELAKPLPDLDHNPTEPSKENAK